MLRSLAAAALAAVLGLSMIPTDASARVQGGFRGGPVFRGGPAVRSFAPAFRGNFVNRGFRGPGMINPGVRFANPGFRRFHPGFRPGFRRFGYVGLPLIGAYAGYSYYNNQCVVPQTVMTPWGYRTRWINVCYDDDYLY